MLEKVESYVDSRFILRVFQKVFTYFSPITIIFTTLLTMWIINYNRKRARMVRLIDKIPGPPALPFIGEFLEILFFSRFQKFLILFSGNAIEINVEHDGKENRKKPSEKIRFHLKT